MKKKLLVVAAALGLPFIAFAQEAMGPLYTFTIIPDSLMSYMHALNLVLGLLGAFYAVKLAALSQGGELEKTWNGLALAAVLFAASHVINALDHFGFVALGGASELMGLLLAGTLVYTFVTTRKNLLKKILG